jgi:hypothetical protein
LRGELYEELCAKLCDEVVFPCRGHQEGAVTGAVKNALAHQNMTCGQHDEARPAFAPACAV